MLSAISDFLSNLWQSISNVIDFLISTVKDIIYFIGLLISTPSYIVNCVSWLPEIIAVVILSSISLIIILRVTKYLGD